jgi:hypothetical protein
MQKCHVRRVIGLCFVLGIWILFPLSCKKSSPTQPQTEPDISEGGPQDLGKWKIIFRDDFEGNALDRTKRDPYYTWGKLSQVERHLNYDGWAMDGNAIVENGLPPLPA